MTEHTKGRLRVDPNYPNDLQSEDGTLEFGYLLWDGIQDTTFNPQGPFPERFEANANTRRLVACWNALEGIPTEDIEATADDPSRVVRALTSKGGPPR